MLIGPVAYASHALALLSIRPFVADSPQVNFSLQYVIQKHPRWRRLLATKLATLDQAGAVNADTSLAKWGVLYTSKQGSNQVPKLGK